MPIAKRLGLSSVLGYIIAGMIIGPYILGLIGQKGKDVMHFAEFGVVMMLFFDWTRIRAKQVLAPSAVYCWNGCISGDFKHRFFGRWNAFYS